MMDSKQKTYMLLPHFHFRPDKQVKLGILIPLSRDTKRPDPEKPLNAKTHTPVEAPAKETFTMKDWSTNQTQTRSFLTGLWAESSLLTGVGAGVNIGKSQRHGLKVRCESMAIEWFTPSDEYIALSLKDDLVQSYLQKHIRPSVYMITGLMIAEKAQITAADGKDKELEGEFSVDGTQFGVPIKVGPNGSFSTGEQSKVMFQSDEPFILAYRLKRVRQKRDGSFEDRDVNKWALFNDDKEPTSNLFELVEVEDVRPDTFHDV